MSERSDWLADIGKAVDELGYGIVLLEPRRIELAPLRQTAGTVVVESIFLSGDHLRRTLRPLEDAYPVTKP